MSEDLEMKVSFGAADPLVEFPLESLTVSIPLTQVDKGLYRKRPVGGFSRGSLSTRPDLNRAAPRVVPTTPVPRLVGAIAAGSGYAQAHE